MAWHWACDKPQGCQVLLNFSILLLKLQFCYWNFHEILAKILKFVLISQLFTHKNTEICVKLCKNTEIIAIRYWSEFPEVGSPEAITWVDIDPFPRLIYLALGGDELIYFTDKGTPHMYIWK